MAIIIPACQLLVRKARENISPQRYTFLWFFFTDSMASIASVKNRR